MGFLDDIKNGLPGIKLTIPENWKKQDEQDRRVVLVDEQRKVGWHILHAPWRVDLRPEFAELHRRDIERHARFGFEQHYHQVQAPPGAQRPPVRTSDPEFQPLLSSEYVEIDGVRCLSTLRRVAYEPILEAVVGNLLIPVGTGIVDITCFHHSQQTGYREQQLLTLAMQQSPGEGAQKLQRRLGLKHFDDPAHDDKFPTHPLTCVRKALRWLLSLSPDQLSVTQKPAPLPAPDAEVELGTAGCAIKVPPRYVQVPAGVLPVPAGVALLSRVVLEGADDPQMLDVRQIAGVMLPPGKRQEGLEQMVQRQIAEWQGQGATNIEMNSEPLDMPVDEKIPGEGERSGLAVQVNMLLGGTPTHTVARWIADRDGRVFRIGIATPPYTPVAEAVVDIDRVLKSWRRLPPKSSGFWLTSDEVRLAPAARAKLAAQAQDQAQK